MRLLLICTALLFPAPALAHVPLPHVSWQVSVGDCPYQIYKDMVGCYFEKPFGVHRIYYDGDLQVYLHEVGHIFDATEMQPPDRDKFKHIFGLEPLGWHDDPLHVNAAPAEWFADAYSRCMTHDRDGIRSWQHRASCRVIWLADKERNG